MSMSMTTPLPSIARYLMHANHHAHSTRADIERLCQEALEQGFSGVFVNPTHVRLASRLLQGRVPVGTTVGFTLGQDVLGTKLAALRQAVADGANELDMYPDVSSLKEKNWEGFRKEVSALVAEARGQRAQVVTRIVLEPGLLEEEERRQCALLIASAEADYVKIGSGFGPRPPTLEDVAQVRAALGERLLLKVAGGVRTYAQAKAFIEAGAVRIGTSSALKIEQEARTGQSSPPPQGGPADQGGE